MNIFVLHRDPYICAQMHCDKHIVKMIIESAQLLYTCCLMWGIVGNDIREFITTAPITTKGTHGYKMTHKHHPCCKWLSESVENYHWLVTMAKELCVEYTRRYKKIHATEQHIDWLSYVCPDIPNMPMTPFAMAMPNDCKYTEHDGNINPVKSYRMYYCKEKTFAKWAHSTVPIWYTPM